MSNTVDTTAYIARQARMVRQDEADARRARFLEVEPKDVGADLQELCGSVAEREESEAHAATNAMLDEEEAVWSSAWRKEEKAGSHENQCRKAARTALCEFQVGRDRAAVKERGETIELPSLEELGAIDKGTDLEPRPGNAGSVPNLAPMLRG